MFFGILLIVPLLSACSNAFKSEKDIEADKIALENSRAQAFGASGAAFSPDGSLVAIGSRDIVWVADARTRVTIARLTDPGTYRFGGRKSLRFIGNQRIVIGADGAILLWDLKEGLITDRYTFASTLLSPRAIAWSDATQTLAFSSGSTIESVRLVHIGEDGFDQTREFPGFEGVPADLIFSRDGLYLAATGDGQGVIIRDVATGSLVGELPTEGFADNLEAFGENSLLVSGTAIAVWTFLAEKEATEFENANLHGQVTNQVVARTAGTVVLGTLTVFGAFVSLMGGGGDFTELGQATYLYATSPIESSHQPWCGRSTSISPDGKWLVDVYPGITSEVIRIFNMDSGEFVKSLNPKGEYHCVAKFSPDSKQLLITSDKVARLYDTDTWQHHDIRLD